jgi:ankyrin repeat protein
MDSILCGSIPEISKLLEHPFSLQGRNSLGQTAAHVAVLRPDVLSMLLQNFSTLDVAKIDEKDSYGNSPLTYAAAYGQTDSVIHLLKAGADPLMDGHLEFLQWAFFWDHWDVATEAFALFRATARFSEAYLQSELHHMMAGKAWYHGHWWGPVYRGRSAEFLGKLFNLGLDKHMLFEDGNTLLHLAYDPMWMDCLFNAAFSQIDHCNNEGETALMTFVQYRSRLVRQILRRGCNANHRNIRGETALSKACAEGFLFWVPYSIHKTTLDSSVLEHISTHLAVIANLLQHGADPSIHDNCRCPCAPDGCSPLRRLLRSHGQTIGYIWIIECLLMLIEIQGRTIAENTFLEINRLHEFQLADMTHVCCNRKYSIADEPMDEAEVDEIIEEEKEFGAILDEKMRDISSSADNKSIEESWLSILFDFRIPDEPLKSKKYWMSWGSGVEYYYEIFPEMVPLTSSTLISHDNMKPGIARADEETDKYWTLREVTDGHAMPQSSIYSAWVEWVYQNPDKYDYPLPVDRDWYEKRKYWATRQAQVLEGLFD